MRRALFVVLIAATVSVTGFSIIPRARGDVPEFTGPLHCDVLRLTDGTIRMGTMLSFDGAVVEFKTSQTLLRLPRKQVAAVLFGAVEGEQSGGAAGSLVDPEVEAAPNLNLTGTWRSPEWGAMRLVQKGRRIYGTYDWDSGQIDGYLEGDEIRFWWWEKTPLSRPFNDAAEGERGDGFFKISEGGRKLAGAWRYASAMKSGSVPASAWTAVKSGLLPADFNYRPPAFTIPEGATRW